jgi:hypothetical protein
MNWERIEGKWNVTVRQGKSISEFGVAYESCEFTTTTDNSEFGDGDFIYKYVTTNSSDTTISNGAWYWTDNGDGIYIYFSDANGNYYEWNYNIKKLTNNKMTWGELTYDNSDESWDWEFSKVE